MGVIVIILFVALLVFLIVRALKRFLTNRFLKEKFTHGNGVIIGKIGKGKDLTIQYIINLLNQAYYANLDYGNKLKKIVHPCELSISPNDYRSFMYGCVVPIDKKFDENCNFYISDSGLYFPSHFDSELSKEFKGVPGFMALSRHLYNAHVHMNIQDFGRLWLKIREQADFCIVCKGVKKSLFSLKCTFIYYDKWQSAEQGLLPLPKRWNKDSKNQHDLYTSQHGLIKEFTFKIKKKNIYYDTRYFHSVMFGYPAPQTKNIGLLQKIKDKFKKKGSLTNLEK